MKKILLILLFAALPSIAFVVVLKRSIEYKKPGGGFTRAYRDDFLGEIDVLDLKFNSYYIAGRSRDTIFLGNVSLGSHAIAVPTHSLRDSSHFKLAFPAAGYSLADLNVVIDSCQAYVFETTTPSVLTASGLGRSFHSMPFKRVAFLNMPAFISGSSLVVNTYDSALRKAVMTKITFGSGEPTSVDNLVKQVDGVLCTDGRFVYERGRAELIYIYHYRNTILKLDTNLRVLETRRTIDTTRSSKLKVERVKSDNRYTFTAPPYVVNKNACLNGDWLLIQSRVRADNDPDEPGSSFETIDVYSLRDLNYRFSFRLPVTPNEIIVSFAATDQYLFVVQGNRLERYLVTWPLVF